MESSNLISDDFVSEMISKQGVISRDSEEPKPKILKLKIKESVDPEKYKNRMIGFSSNPSHAESFEKLNK